MLKAQLHSKIFQLDSSWRDIEDLLTGDFFGALDYLPRDPFLRSLLLRVAELNPDKRPPKDCGEAWNNVELIFWPMISTGDEIAEPDVLIISENWVIVVEVKLDSGLGSRQPWREYCVGKEIAKERGIPKESVYYLLVTRDTPDVESTFASDKLVERDELLPKTFYLRWSQVISLVDSWNRLDLDSIVISSENSRLLIDLLNVLRLRRVFVFSGFAFANQNHVDLPLSQWFCPPRFQGFLGGCHSPIDQSVGVFLSQFSGFVMRTISAVSFDTSVWTIGSFDGFLTNITVVSDSTSTLVLGETVHGFLKSSRSVTLPTDRTFGAPKFSGFLESTVTCHPHETLVLSDMPQ